MTEEMKEEIDGMKMDLMTEGMMGEIMIEGMKVEIATEAVEVVPTDTLQTMTGGMMEIEEIEVAQMTVLHLTDMVVLRCMVANAGDDNSR